MTQRAAAEAVGMSAGAIRRWRKAGTIAERPASHDPGTIEVFVTSERRRSAATQSTTPEGGDGSDAPHSELGVLVPLEIHQRSLAELILRLTDTTERAVRAEARVEMLEAQLAELRPSATQPTGTLPSPPPRRRK